MISDNLLISNARVMDPASGAEFYGDALIKHGIIQKITKRHHAGMSPIPPPPRHGDSPEPARHDGETGAPPSRGRVKLIDARGACMAPALWDLHVHLRDLNESHKETVASGAKAAAAGGVGHLLAMPNTQPPIDNITTLRLLQKKAKAQTQWVDIEFIACVSLGRSGEKPVDFKKLAQAGAVAFSDDGNQIKTEALLAYSLKETARWGGFVIDHCDTPSEEEAVKRDIRVLSKNPGRLHIAHVSTKDALRAIRKAKKEGLTGRLTCEAAPHHFSLTKESVKQYGAAAKVNPPLASRQDVEAIHEALTDGTIDAIASDHAPHGARKTSQPLNIALPGMIGLETMFAVAMTYLVRPKILSLSQALKLLTIQPALLLKRKPPLLRAGQPADLFLMDSQAEVVFHSFQSRSANTPFKGRPLHGRILLTVHRGNIIHDSCKS